MIDFGSSLRVLRRLFAGRGAQPPAAGGQSLVLDGLSAVAALEAGICESAGLGAGWPASAAARGWARIEADGGKNQVGALRSSVSAGDARGALAAALGQAASGQRAVAFVSGRDLVGMQDLMIAAAQRCTPLVLHLVARAPVRHADALGGGHEAYHAVADAGWIQFFARDVQEAIDLSLVARHVSERTLIPVLVAMDVETAVGVQDVILPDESVLARFIGAPWELIETTTPAQRTLFGEARRRMPRWFDVDHPMLLSPACGPESWALGALGARAFFADHAEAAVAESSEAFAHLTGRAVDAVSVTHGAHDILLIAQGAAIEPASAVADRLRSHDRKKVGVLGVRRLRPWPGAHVARWLDKTNVIAVLERVDAPLSPDGPLTREVRAVLDRCRENARFGDDLHIGYPAIPDKRLPRVVTVPYGLGGYPLRAADLAALAQELEQPTRSLVALGIPATRETSAYPKRQAAIDALARDCPGLTDLSLHGDAAGVDLLPRETLSLAVVRPAGRDWASLAADAAALAHDLFGLHVRVEPGLSWPRPDGTHKDILTIGTQRVEAVGADAPVDVVVRISPRIGGPRDDIYLREGARWMIVEADADDAIETVLGSIVALLPERMRRPAPSVTRMREARASLLADVDSDRREARLTACAHAFGEPLPLHSSDPSADQAAADGEQVPRIARAIARDDTHVDALPRFWDQVGVLYRDGAEDELSSDPYLATGAVPVLSGVFHARRTAVTSAIDFDAESCEGDGRLWTSCPDGSVAPLVLSTRALIDSGIELAAAEGAAVDELRGVAAALAKAAHRHVKGSESRGTTAGDLIRAAFAMLCERSAFPAERVPVLTQAVDAVAECVGDLPLSRTRAFFDDAESARSGAGELFALVVNPETCRCPELLLKVGAGRGLRACDATPENIARLRRLWTLWERMPDVSGETIERVRAHPDVGALAAIMLSRFCLHTLAPGGADAPASGARLALRSILGIAESHLQPRVQQVLKRVESLRQRLAERIRELLADALPTNDLDQLAGGLATLGGNDVDLSKLTDTVEGAIGGGRVDGVRLRRIVECSRGLADLHWRLSTGVNDLGRSRWSMSIAGDSLAQLLCVFPDNPFSGPVAVDPGAACGRYAAGLIEGQMRQHLATVRLLRWADAELDQPKEAEHIAARLEQLREEDLSAAELGLVPPLLLVGDGRTFAERGLGELTWILNTRLPIKVLILSEAGGSIDSGLSVDALAAFPSAQRFDVALTALLARNGFVAQVSLGAPEHLARTTLRALEFAGAAAIHVHAPIPERHGFEGALLLEQARLALTSRAFPVFAFDPATEGVFGGCLDLSGNPSPDAILHCEGDERVTPADWAAREARFDVHLAALGEDARGPTPIAEFLELDAKERAQRTPTVLVESVAQAVRRAVGPELVRDAEDRLRFWRVLQELAGVVTPFTQTVQQQAERDAAASHASRLEQMQIDHEAQLAELERTFSGRATQRVTARLLQLTGYSGADGGGKDEDA